MEVVGVIGSSIAIFDALQKLRRYARDVINAPKEREDFDYRLNCVEAVIKAVKGAESAAAPDAVWVHELNPTRANSAVYRLLLTMEKMADILRVDINDDSLKAKFKNYKWHSEKKELETLLNQVKDHCIVILIILQWGDIEILKGIGRGIEELAVDVKANRELIEESRKRRGEMDAVALKTASDVADVKIESGENIVLARQMAMRLNSVESSVLAEEATKRIEREIAMRKRVEKWLSPLEFQQRQQIIFDKAAAFRKGRIGKWFFDCEEFRLWRDGLIKTMWGYGAPGSGKVGVTFMMDRRRVLADAEKQTVLSSVVINEISSGFPEIPVLCVYLEKTEGHVQTPKNIRGSLLKQLIQFRESGLAPAIQTAFEKASRTDTLPNDRETSALLKAEMESYDRVFLVVDGLDEASHESRRLIEDKLLTISSKLSTLIMTRRDDETDLEERCCDFCEEVCVQYYHCADCEKLSQEVFMCFACKAKDEKCANENGASHNLEAITPERCEVLIETPDEDIASFVYSSIKDQFPAGRKPTDLGTQRRGLKFTVWKCFRDPILLNKIVKYITDNADGRFLLAREYLKHFLNKNDMRDIKAALESRENDGTEKVFPFYAEDMERIMKQEPEDAELARKVFSTVFFAKRNLTLTQLLQAIDTQSDDREYIDGERDETVILNVTKGLIAIERTSLQDGDMCGMIVRFDHLTRREFFEYQYTWKTWFPNGLVAMASTCLTFLSFDTFAEPCHTEEEFQAKESELPFVSYAVQFWGDHVREAGPDAKEITNAAIKYLQDPHRVEAYIQAAWIANTRHREKWDVRRDIHPLHICAWFDLSFLMPFLKHDPKDINIQEDTHGQTPLMYACRRGSVETVRWLLTLGALVNKRSEKGRTALFEALLRLKKEPKNNSAHDVVKSRQIVDLLLNNELRGRQINVNRRNPRHLQQTALITSIEWQQPKIALAILKHPNLKINVQDLDGTSALHLAACNDFPEVVEQILQHPSTVVDLSDDCSRTPLHLSAQFGTNPQVIEQLLAHGADPNKNDDRGGPVIMRATESGNDQGFETLVNSAKEIKPELTCTDEDGRSLWHHAAASGSVTMIEMLKKWIPSHLNAPDAVEMTPLHDACKFGQLEAARKLLEYGASPTVQDKLERTPFTIVRQYGHENLLGLFQEDEIKPSVDVVSQKLPLWSLATLRRLDSITNGISTKSLSFTDIEPRTQRTALHCVLLSGGGESGKDDTQVEILRQLLSTGKLSPDDVDAHNQTPLHFAALEGNIDATQVLLSHEANPDVVDRFGMTPLRIACRNKFLSVGVALIEAGASIDQSKLDLDELLFAALTAQKATAVGRLMAAGANRMAQDEEGRTPEMVAKKDTRLVGILKSTKSYMWKATTMSEKEEIGIDLIEDTIGDAVEMLNDIRGRRAVTSPRLTINGKAAKDVRFVPFTSRGVDLVDEKKAGKVSVAAVPSPNVPMRSFEKAEGLLEGISEKESSGMKSRPTQGQDAVLCN